MATDEERKKKFEEDITKKINELPLEIRIKALALRNYLNEKNALDEQLDKETIQMHKKYEGLSEPFYKKTGDIVDGKLPVPEESIADLDNYVTEAEKEAATAAKGASILKEYWFKALKNCDSIAQEIREKDFDALKNLVKIDIIKDGNEKDFTLVFHFSANEFFSNENLSKRFFMKDADTPEKSEGTEIQWKDGKNLTKKQVKKKQKNKKSGQQRVVTKEVDDESFFNFFKSINVDEKELEKIEDDEEVEKVQERMDIDFEISQVILDELYPYSLEYFLGVKEAFGDDLHDLEPEDAEDEDLEQEEAPKPKKKKNKKKKNAQKEGDAAAPSQNPGAKPECAQSQT